MRPISASSLSNVAGGELQQYFEPPPHGKGDGSRLDVFGQRDGSTDIHLRDRSGKSMWIKNSGIGLGCYMAAAGVGTIVGTLAGGNPVAGGIAGFTAGQGCNVLGHSSHSRR